MIIIRDINGNRLTKTARHFDTHVLNVTKYHKDSTGLFVIHYHNDGFETFAAFIRPETASERRLVSIATRMGEERDV